MGMAALIFGILGGLCTVMGILSAAEIAPQVLGASVAFTTAGWGGLAVILLLGCIAALIAQGGYE